MKKKIKIVPIIIVRIDSRRLFGKCFLPIHKKKNILQCIKTQLKNIKNLSEPILAIPDDTINSPLKEFAIANKISFYAGKKHNVALRVLNAAIYFKADYILRINADSPIIDKNLISNAISNKDFHKYCYHSNIIKRTYPYGISLQIIKTIFLSKLLLKNNKKYDLEHITPLFEKEKNKKFYKSYKLKKKFFWKKHLTIDNIDDYNSLKKVFMRINVFKKNFNWLKSKNLRKYLLNG